MEKNDEMRLAWEFVEHTGKSIFLTGKAGTGKTTFLKTVWEHSTKRMVIVAPTGVAAVNAGGVTIHSFFQLPLSPFVPNATIKNRFDFSKEKRKIISTIDMLVIDEISMVRSDLLDAIDSVLRRFREHNKPFGGVQLLMIGDLGQLTPVVTPEDERMLKPYYDTPYFFGSHALQLTDYVTIQLDHVYRQQDERFLDILNHIRRGMPTADDLALLNSRAQPFRREDAEGYIRLTTHNQMADRYNQSSLEQLPTRAYNYQAEVEGTFPEYAYPTAERMTLKVGAQVMFVKNDTSADHLYYNGRIGKVVFLDEKTIKVACPGDAEAIDVQPQEWENAKYKLNEKTKEIETEVVGVFRQYPLRLAWAITIHKSQGLTFDHAIIDANHSFAPGQVYVALSRCRTLEGMRLSAPLTPSAVINDQRVESYLSNQQQTAAESISRLADLKEEYFRYLLTELFDFHRIQQHEESLCRVFIEYFTKSSPALTTLHKQTMTDLKAKVVDVAVKWCRQIGRMPTEALHEDDFLERVKRSSSYFAETLCSLFDVLLQKTKLVQTNNKQAAKRLDTAFTDLQLAFRSQRELLQEMSAQTFSVATYLKVKQEALLDAMGEPRKGNKGERRERREKPPKPKREPTREVTMRLFQQGMQPEAIAQERGLKPSTIYSHLSGAIAEGRLELGDVIPAEKILAVRRAMEKVGEVTDLTALKIFCPPEVSWDELRMICHFS